jgi:VanZ family protein
VLVLLYASLYPFEGWRWPPGASAWSLLRLPWYPQQGGFDDAINFAGYTPLGLLAFVVAVRRGRGAAAALVGAVAVPAALSLALEVMQHLVPGRVPSARDWALNALGATCGALGALVLHASGALDRWQRLRARWFEPDSAVALALLVLWPVGLLFPAPVPLGLGHVFDALQLAVAALLRDAGWTAAAADLVARAGQREPPLPPLREGACIVLGLLAPTLLALCVTRTPGRRLVMALGALPVALAAMTLSTALNFGPAHALAWMLPSVGPALLVATVCGVVACGLSVRTNAALALAVLAALVALVAQAPADPYYAASLQGWEQGRFVRFHGLAQWIGWLWPYAAIAWLLSRLSRRS